MIEIFRDQIKEYTSDMPRLQRESDFKNLARLAHKAKSSVAVMGMSKEAELLKDLELKSEQGIDTETYGEIIEQFIRSSELALQELDDYVTKHQ